MRQPPPNDSQIYDVYIDESSQTNHRYLVLGGIVLPKRNVPGLIEMIWERRGADLPPGGEMKWGKVSPSKLAAYKRVVDAFFILGNAVHFHSLVVDTSRQKHGIYNQGSREIGFNKEVYQLSLKCGRLYPLLFHIYPDHRTTDQQPEDLRLMLNRGIAKKGDKRDWPFRRLQFRNSKKTEMLQLADIFAGAIAHRLNGHDMRPGASAAKREMCEHILGQAKVKDVFRDTAVSGKFTIWHRQLR
jgi:hypothetical protein